MWGAFGLHPHNASRYNETIEEQLIKACSHPKCVAWGEMGLDYGEYLKIRINPIKSAQ